MKTLTETVDDQTNWSYKGSFTGGPADLSGFTPGATLWVRVRKIGNASLRMLVLALCTCASTKPERLVRLHVCLVVSNGDAVAVRVRDLPGRINRALFFGLIRSGGAKEKSYSCMEFAPLHRQ